MLELLAGFAGKHGITDDALDLTSLRAIIA